MLIPLEAVQCYKALQAALDDNPEDQSLRLMLADWYEERGRGFAAECMHWLATNNQWPYISGSKKYGAGWTRMENPTKVYDHHRLPAEVFYELEPYYGGRLTTIKYPDPQDGWGWWWEYCESRQRAEEAAVLAWEKWRQKA